MAWIAGRWYTMPVPEPPKKKKKQSPFRDGVRRMTLTFGKFVGKKITDPIVTDEYLQILYESSLKTANACKEELDRRNSIVKASLGMTEQIIQAGYKEMAKKCHPDTGGSNDQFQELQGSYQQLKGVISEVKTSLKG